MAQPTNKARFAAALLVLSSAGFATWQASEGFAPVAHIPTKGDVPTIGNGSTRYEDDTPVKLGDRITRQRAAELARNLANKDCARMAATIATVEITQGEFDLYCNFSGQYGLGNWRGSSMRKHLLAGDHVAACKSLLLYRKAAGYDCSTLVDGKPNDRCWGVWTRQLDRYKACMGEQS
jgi:GH24 family phage-related lysozyme (muramidase)